MAEFSTTGGGLAGLADWLAGFGVTHVTMEATGIYWRPVFFSLEADFELMLVNAAHMRNVPGRKTDVADARWIAELAEHGLLRPSFVPPPDVRRLRNLTRYRKTLINERGRVIQRLEKNMQDAGVKLSSVTSTTLSVTFRRICEAMIDGERDPARLAALTKGRLRPKMAEIEQALVNHFDDHHAAVARCGLAHLDQIDVGISEVSAVIAKVIEPHRWALDLLITIPGVSTRVVECLISRNAASDMAQFPTAGHLVVGGHVPGQQQIRRQDRAGHDPAGPDLAAATLDRSRSRRCPHPEQPPRCCSAPQDPSQTRVQTGGCCHWACDLAGDVAHAVPPGGLQQPGRGLLQGRQRR